MLRDWLAGETYTPIEFPVGVLSKDLGERRKQITCLRQASKEVSGTGYLLEWETINTQALGSQTIPRRVRIGTLDDYLGLIRKKLEFQYFTEATATIRQAFPGLDPWMQSRPQLVIEHCGRWNDLLRVSKYFVQHPRPNQYIRELPIPIHTKFIETNTGILRDLLDTLLPAEFVNHEARILSHILVSEINRY